MLLVYKAVIDLFVEFDIKEEFAVSTFRKKLTRTKN
jgi:hypothetical protein